MTHAEALYELFLQHSVVSTDSRQITEGCIFFALKGERFDGNRYALEALDRGASYAVVDDPELPEHPQLLQVDDTLLALQELAALHRAQLATPVIAITGTNGKTTTKELTAAVLKTTFNVLYTEGNLNNHIGVPLTLLRLRPEHDFALIEMGASKPGDIDELCQIAQPNYGLITNIGEAHLQGFGDVEGVARTKAELYSWLRTHEGKAFRHEDDERLAQLGKGIPSVTYGTSPEAVIRAVPKANARGLFLSFAWEASAIQIPLREQTTQLVGAYNLSNVLAAIAIGLFFGVDSEHLQEAIAHYQPRSSRSQYLETGRNAVIADAYNANPSSMLSALENFLAIPSEHEKLVILGDMNELGSSATEAHRRIYDRLAPELEQGLSGILCGPQWTALAQAYPVKTLPDVEALEVYLRAHRPEGKLILVKGSHDIGLERILPLL